MREAIKVKFATKKYEPHNKLLPYAASCDYRRNLTAGSPPLSIGTLYYCLMAAGHFMKAILTFSAIAIPLICNGQIISTVAGMGSPGYNGDSIAASSAKLNQPSEIIVDSHENLYINDSYNERIRKVATSNIITTSAGTGVAGYNGDGGFADTSKVSNGVGKVLVDRHNNLYFADGNNHRIRKIDAMTGIITTIAGNGVPGFSGDGLPATSAQLNYPGHIAIDKNGNIYIADVLNKRIRKVDAFGVISTYAGTGAIGFSGDGGNADTAKFSSSLLGLACDTFCNLYIADRLNGRIRKIDFTTHIIMTIAGNGTGVYAGTGIPATSEGICPGGLAINASGNLFIADFLNMRIYKIAASGLIYSIAGNGFAGYSGDGGLADTSKLNYPYDVAFDGCDNLYIADASNERVRKVTFNPACTLSSLNINTTVTNSITSVYPNPANEQITITASQLIANVTITNLIGQTLLNENFKSETAEVNISKLPPGVYLVTATDEKGKRTLRKIVKQ